MNLRGSRRWLPAVIVLLLGLLSLAGLVQPARRGLLDEAFRALHQADYARATMLANRYLKTHPGNSGARVLLAQVLIAQGDLPAAFQKLREALTIDPRNVDALYYLGSVAGALSQAELQRLYAAAPESARVHQLMAESLKAQERMTEAEQEYRAALEANPRSVELLVALGDLKRGQSAFDDAMDYYSRAHQIEPRSYDGVYGLGVCHSYRQDHARAIEYFRRAVSLDPDSAPARLALGDSLLRSGQAEAALVELKAAAALEPGMHQAHYLVGRIYQRLGHAEEAAASFARVDELLKGELEAAKARRSSGDVLGVAPPPQKRPK